MLLAGKTALVTGGGRNIGRATVLTLAREGANVAVHGLTSKKEVEQVAEEARASGVRAMSVLAEITDERQVNEMVTRVHNDLGPIDILVNNVGIRPWCPFLKMTAEEWDYQLKVNLYGAFYMCKAVLPSMVERRSGVIINLTGSATHQPRIAHKIHGHVSKAGKLALTRGLAQEFGPYGIRVNAVAPSMVFTERPHAEWYPEDDFPAWARSGATSDEATREAAVREMIQRVPLRRLVVPQDIANAILFLASDLASSITGQSLFVNGGTVMV